MHKNPWFFAWSDEQIRAFEHQLLGLSVDQSVTVSSIAQGTSIFEVAKSVLLDAHARFDLAGLGIGGIVAMEILRIAPDIMSKLAFTYKTLWLKQLKSRLFGNRKL